MFSVSRNLGLALALTVFAFAPASSYGQEISASHLAAAKKAISATKATDSFDNILVGASARLKNALTGNNPDLADQISIIVDEEAIALAKRRADLEGEAARLFANSFNEAELADITTFFNSPAGGKYLAATPILARELGKSARIWAGGVTRDLNVNVQKRMAELTKK